MSEGNKKLARTTWGVLDYIYMKNTIMKIFSDPLGADDSSSGIFAVKQECFYGNVKNDQNKPLGKFVFRQGNN